MREGVRERGSGRCIERKARNRDGNEAEVEDNRDGSTVDTDSIATLGEQKYNRLHNYFIQSLGRAPADVRKDFRDRLSDMQARFRILKKSGTFDFDEAFKQLERIVSDFLADRRLDDLRKNLKAKKKREMARPYPAVRLR